VHLVGVTLAVGSLPDVQMGPISLFSLPIIRNHNYKVTEELL
jgi:hypothetical protein